MSDLVSPFTDPNAPLYLGDPIGISAYADEQTDAANAYLLRLGDATAGLAPPVIDPVFPDGPSAPAIETSTPPTLSPVVWTSPTAPAEFTDTLDVSSYFVAPFTGVAPDLVFDDAPTFSETAPDSPAVDLSFTLPDLTVDLPARPNLLSLNIATFDGVNFPTFDAEAPVVDLVAPSIREYVPGAQYTSALLTSLKTSLQQRIDEGGTGLNQDVENAIWDRGREREARSARDALAELDRMESLGFMLPPGGYIDARIKIATETDYANRGHSREVMIKSAELEQENVKHALTTATELESRLIDYTNSVEQRLFEATKYATEAGISVYNAKVQAYGIMVEVYRAQAQVYQALVQAEVSRVDAYRAQVEAESAKAQVNRILVDQYQTEINAALSNIEIFKARIDAIQVQANIEKTKVDIFGQQVQAYATKVNAYTAGVEGFRAKIEAESAKQAAFTSQVQAYSATVEANGKVIDSRIAAYRGALDAYTARWDGYKSAYQAEAARAQAIASYNTSLSDSYRAEVQGIVAYNETLTKQWQVSLEQAERVADIGINAAKANAELYVTTRSLALDVAKVGAQVSAQLGAAALNAINWSTSYSNAWGFSNSTSYSRSSSDSTSDSTSVNYNYSV